jgi:D-aminoacyl-tRNA deacylase
VHAEGNWSDKNELGGEPKQLSVAAPKAMLSVLIELSKQEPKDIGITYEATHHGPLLKTPSLFVELGGDEATIEDTGMAKILAAAVANSIQKDDYDYKKVALGIGGTHYPRKFTQSAIGGEYAFAHIMSKYYVHEIDMLDQAVERSNPRPEVAAIEWKSVNSSDRASIINKLNQMGLDYVRL